MGRGISSVALLIRDYDEAIAYYTGRLGFDLIADADLGGGKRWMQVAPPGGTALLLARAATPEQLARVGDQTGGRVFLFLATDDFRRDYLAMRERGVRFTEEPRDEAYGTVAVFVDLYGNRWDLVQAPEDNESAGVTRQRNKPGKSAKQPIARSGGPGVECKAR